MFVHPAASVPYLLPRKLKIGNLVRKKKNNMEFIILIKLLNKICGKI